MRACARACVEIQKGGGRGRENRMDALWGGGAIGVRGFRVADEYWWAGILRGGRDRGRGAFSSPAQKTRVLAEPSTPLSRSHKVSLLGAVKAPDACPLSA